MKKFKLCQYHLISVSFMLSKLTKITYRLRRARYRCLSASPSWRRFRPATFRQWSGYQFCGSRDATPHFLWSCCRGCISEPSLCDRNKQFNKTFYCQSRWISAFNIKHDFHSLHYCQPNSPIVAVTKRNFFLVYRCFLKFLRIFGKFLVEYYFKLSQRKSTLSLHF